MNLGIPFQSYWRNANFLHENICKKKREVLVLFDKQLITIHYINNSFVKQFLTVIDISLVYSFISSTK